MWTSRRNLVCVGVEANVDEKVEEEERVCVCVRA